MSNWKYRIIKKSKNCYYIAEVFGKYGYTEPSIEYYASPKELIQTLIMQLADCMEYPVYVPKKQKVKIDKLK